MTPLQISILSYLDDYYAIFVSPSEIGGAVGKRDFNSASAWASPKLKSLVGKGLVERSTDGRYHITKDGRGVVKEYRRAKAMEQ